MIVWAIPPPSFHFSNPPSYLPLWSLPPVRRAKRRFVLMDKKTISPGLGILGCLPLELRQKVFGLVMQGAFSINLDSETNVLSHTRCASLKLSRQLRSENFAAWFENGRFVVDDPSALELFVGSDAEPFRPIFQGQMDRPRRLKSLHVFLLRPLEKVDLTTVERGGHDGPNIDAFSRRWRQAFNRLRNTLRYVMLNFSHGAFRLHPPPCIARIIMILCGVLHVRTAGSVRFQVVGCTTSYGWCIINSCVPDNRLTAKTPSGPRNDI